MITGFLRALAWKSNGSSAITPYIQYVLLGSHLFNETSFQRFTEMHVLLPLVLTGFIAAHLLTLHSIGSTQASSVTALSSIGLGTYVIKEDTLALASLVMVLFLWL